MAEGTDKQPNTNGTPLQSEFITSGSRTGFGTASGETRLPEVPAAPSNLQDIMQSKVLGYMMAKRLGQDIDIEGYVRGELTFHQLEDIHNTLFVLVDLPGSSVLLHNRLKEAYADLWPCLESSNAYTVERDLQIPHSTCMCLDINEEGDYEVRVRINRKKGLQFARKYGLIRHVHFPLNQCRELQ